VTGDQRGSGDWARYWRSGDEAGAAAGAAGPIEAMHAHFRSHVYHRHSHETYSFGVTDDGAQAFTCRGGHHVSAANMVMLFNPDDPHDGHAATGPGFTYRMIHIAPAQVEELLGDAGVRVGNRPLFPAPVVDDPALARRLRLLHTALTSPAPSPSSQHEPATPLASLGPSASLAPSAPLTPSASLVPLRHHESTTPPTPLQQHEYLTSTLRLLARNATSATVVPSDDALCPAAGLIARRVRDRLHDGYAAPLTADDLAAAAGCSRYAASRAFTAVYGLAPSDYQRQLRLRTARALLTRGASAAEAAATAGFADQAHLTRWFRRYYGVTPGVYRQAVASR
jgi:AraC-like DNA-binding protein